MTKEALEDALAVLARNADAVAQRDCAKAKSIVALAYEYEQNEDNVKYSARRSAAPVRIDAAAVYARRAQAVKDAQAAEMRRRAGGTR